MAGIIPRIMKTVPVTARTVQGMARVRSGQAPAWPLSSDRSVRRHSRVKRSSRVRSPGTLACARRPAVTVALETSDAVKLSSCLGDFLRCGGEGDGLVVVLAGDQAVVQAAEQVALGGGVPVAGVFSPVVVGAGAG